MNQKRYLWHFDRLTALLVAFGNLFMGLFIAFRLLINPSFLRDQLGLSMKFPFGVKVVLSFVIVLMAIYVLSDFLKRKHRSRMILAGVETLILAFLLRNTFVVFLFEGLDLEPIGVTIALLLLESVLIYHTLFSKQINTYFRLVKKKES
ncbi:MAG: hypothetical protein JXR88_01465 [Clostridia bacterium]|nr:hypothetical protein [Clostridia bacterium]